jgi:hypothetical protein
MADIHKTFRNFGSVPKRPCTHRAEWRLLQGKPPQHLSAHYQLDCDHGTALITIYEEGDGGDPIYLCDSHAAAMGRTDNSCAGVRSIESQSADISNPTKSDDRTQAPEFAAAEPGASVTSEAVGSPAAAKVGRELSDSSFGGRVRDLTFGNSAKALVDETIWNLATGDYEVYTAALRQGKSAAEAAQAAGGQLAIVHCKISEYTLKIEAVLSESKAAINVGDVIDKPLEHAMLEIISNAAMGDAEKDAAIDQLGGLQEWINRGLDREITPLQAHRIARAVADRANWGARSCLSEELKPAYREVYGNIRSAIRAAVPDAYDLEERVANLYAAKCDLENAPTAKP